MKIEYSQIDEDDGTYDLHGTFTYTKIGEFDILCDYTNNWVLYIDNQFIKSFKSRPEAQSFLEQILK